MYSSRSTLCSAEFGSKVFAILNVILSGLTSLSTTIAIAYIVVQAIQIDYKGKLSHMSDYGKFFMDLVGSGTFIQMILSWVTFMFAVFLVNGVFKKKPEHMHAYFVYGIAVEVLLVLATVTYLIVALVAGEDIEIPISILIVCFFYALILMMIKKTYTKYQTLNQQHSQKPLDEKC